MKMMTKAMKMGMTMMMTMLNGQRPVTPALPDGWKLLNLINDDADDFVHYHDDYFVDYDDDDFINYNYDGLVHYDDDLLHFSQTWL